MGSSCYYRRRRLSFTEDSRRRHQSSWRRRVSAAVVYDALFTLCTFRGNYARDGGGAISMHATSQGSMPEESGQQGSVFHFVKFVSCVFEDNTSGNKGGAVSHLSNTISAAYSECTFDSNSASRGGAASIHGPSTFTSSSFTNNIANQQGGAIHVGSNADITLIGSTVTGNALSGSGGSGSEWSHDSGSEAGSTSSPGLSFYIDDSAPNNGLTMVNMAALQPDELGGSSNLATTCISKDTVCADNQLEGVCSNSAPAGVLCASGPYINAVDCGSPRGASRHAQGCATSGTLTLTLTGSSLASPDRVVVGENEVACQVKSSAADRLTCEVGALAVWGAGATSGNGNAGGFIVKMIEAGSGASSYSSSQGAPARISLALPQVTAAEGDRSSNGGSVITLTGKSFGPVASALAVSIGGTLAGTEVTWISDTSLRFVSPQMSGSAQSHDLDLFVTVAGQTGEDAFSWSFTRPALISVDALAQQPAEGVDFIPMILHGTDFPDVALSSIKVYTLKKGQNEIECENARRITAKRLECEYPEQGAAGCSERTIYVRIAGQTSTENVPLCYLDPTGSPVTGIKASDSITEGGVYPPYTVALLNPLSSGKSITVKISSNKPDQCDVEPKSIVITSNAQGGGKTVTVTTQDDGIYTAKDTIAYQCVIRHAFTTDDPSLATTLGSSGDVSEMTLTVRSTGCGLGEYFGDFDRGANATQCVCGPSYFLPSKSECAACDQEKYVCESPGLTAPAVRSEWWREDPTSDDTSTQPAYRCPYPGTCLGGNSTEGRCVQGHSDTAGPVCAICDKGYVIQGERCVLCPGVASKAGASAPTPPGLWAVFLTTCAIAFAGFLFFLTRPALSKKDQQRVRELIVTSGAGRGSEAVFEHMLAIQLQSKNLPASSCDSPDPPKKQATVVPVSSDAKNNNKDNNKGPSDNEAGIKAFAKLLVELRASLSMAQIHQLYTKIDVDGNGVISLEEFQKFVGDAKKVDKQKAKRESKKKRGRKKPKNIPSKKGLPNGRKEGQGRGFKFPEFDIGTAIRFPSIRLQSLYPTNTALPLHVELPGISLGQLPGLDLEAITRALKSGAMDVPSITLPPIKLKDFPGLPAASKRDLGDVELPSIQLRDFPGVALPTAGLASFRLPSRRLGKIPGVKVPPPPPLPDGSAPDAPRFDLGSLNVPSFCLGDVPGLNLSEIQMQLEAGTLQLADLKLPSLKLEEFLLPRMSLAEPTAPDVDLPAMRASLRSIELPPTSLSAAFPDIDFSVATDFLALEAPKIPVMGANATLPSVELPVAQLGEFPDLDLGGTHPNLDGMLLAGVDFDALNITLPPVTLANFPNMDLPTISAQLRAGALDISSVKLPSLPLKDFPGVTLPDAGGITLPSGTTLDLQNIRLPAVSLDQFAGLALPGMGLSSLKLPVCRLGDFPGIKLPPSPRGLTLPDGFDLATLEVPSFRLGQIPGLDLPKLSLKLQSGQLRLPNLRLPELRLDGDFLLPDIRLLLQIRLKFKLRLKGPRFSDFGKLWEGLSQWLKQVKLPSFELGQFPKLRVPDLSELSVKLPDLDLPELPDVSIKIPDIDLPNMPDVSVKIPGVDLPDLPDLPDLHLENPLGGLMMKFKLLLGFGQVLSYFAITFSSIPWGPRFTGLFNFFELFSFDIFGFFGATSCQLQTGFLGKFGFHMALIPVIVALLSTAYLVAVSRVRKPAPLKNRKGTKFTKESVKSAYFKLTSLLLYTVYVGVSTRIFRLFKCEDIQGTWYLTSDYTVTCFEGEWEKSSLTAYLCMVVYVVGIPLGQFLVLHHNRAYIDEAACMDSIEAHRRHIRVKQQYGSLFKDYNAQCYYYDLVDLLRRLVLTGGLIMVGGDKNSVAQVFLGILVSMMWLCLVLQKKPYKSTWDTALSAMLSFVLVLTLVTGVCLRLFELTLDAADTYQREAFTSLMIATIVIILLVNVAAILAALPCLRPCIVKCIGTGVDNGVTENTGRTAIPGEKKKN